MEEKKSAIFLNFCESITTNRLLLEIRKNENKKKHIKFTTYSFLLPFFLFEIVNFIQLNFETIFFPNIKHVHCYRKNKPNQNNT